MKWSYFYLYVLLDLFSRFVVGWLIAPRESSDLAQVLIAGSCTRQNIQSQQLTIHADRGAAMIAKPLAALLADLGVSESHSRPHVSNDNPFSEAQFTPALAGGARETMKYQPTYPHHFGSLPDARTWAQVFFPWYNFEHHHSGLGLMTPAAVHLGQAAQLWQHRQAVLQQAYMAHAQRFVKGPPQPPALPTAVWINPPAESRGAEPLPSAGATSEGRGPCQERFQTQSSQHAGALLTGCPQEAQCPAGSGSANPQSPLKLERKFLIKVSHLH